MELVVKHPLTSTSHSFIIRSESSDSKALREIFEDKIYLKPSIKFTVDPEDRWADMGGNVGSFSVFAGSIAKRVVCFEAEPSNAEMCRVNVERNGLAGKVEVLHAAVVPDSCSDAAVTLNVCTDPNHFWMHTLMKTKRKSKQVHVPAVKFSDVIAMGLDCLKIDIEGAEIPILKEKPDLSKVRKLVFEWSFDKEPRLQVLREVLAFLGTQFPVVSGRKVPEFTDLWTLYPPATNYFCIKKPT